MKITEGYVINKKDLEINIDKWTNTKGNNVLFITGLSGSGKSTLSKNYSKEYNAKLFSLDDLETGNDPYNTGVINYLRKNFDKYRDFLDNKELYKDGLTEEEYCILGKSAIDYLYTKKEKFIIEGISIYYMHYKKYYDFSGRPMIIKGTSVLRSILRRFKRNANGGKIDWSKELHNELLGLICWYLQDEKMLRSFKKEVKKEGVTMKIVDNLNKKINFDFLMESMSNIAESLNTEALSLEYRSNYYAPSADELRFTLEGFLYFDNARPQVTLVNEVSKHSNLIEEKGFKKKSLSLNNKLIEYYVNKDDENMIIFEDPFSKNFILRYENDFMKEKEASSINYENNYLQESVLDVLKEKDAYAYADVSSSKVTKLAEKILNKNNITLGNSLIKEHLSTIAFDMSKELNECYSDLYDIVYTEDVVAGNILPRLTFIDKEFKSAEGTIYLAYKESYNNNYDIVAVKVYADDEISESLNKFFPNIVEY